MATTSPPQSLTKPRGPLAKALVALAGTPDDAPGLDRQLDEIAQLAADSVAAADYASITALRDDDYLTVAASSRLAEAVDQAQYAEQAGPCLQSLAEDAPVTVPEIPATMAWPGFHEAAARMGLHASVSIPLFTGSGTTIAVLNLYGRDAGAMAPLIAGVWAVFDPDKPLPTDDRQPLDAGAEDLLTGFAEALSVRATIQLALSTIMTRTGAGARQAYLQLRLHAAEAGVSLPGAAGTVVARDLAPGDVPPAGA
jgi:hypothetical protein